MATIEKRGTFWRVKDRRAGLPANGPLLQMWALDYASAAILIRTQLELSEDNGLPVKWMGRAGVLNALARNTFWAPAKRKLDPVVLERAALLDAAQMPQIFERLRAAKI